MKYLKLFENYEDFSKFVKNVNFWKIGELKTVPFNSLRGEIIHDIIINSNKSSILFIIEGQGEYLFYQMHHEQDCCESVLINDINGDLSDLIGEVVTQADESSSDAKGDEIGDDAGVWTFYKLATIKGYVTIRWLGISNGYYAMDVEFKKGSKTIQSYDDLQNFYKVGDDKIMGSL